MTRKQRLTDQYDAVNLEFATKFAADPAKYPPGSIEAQWADLVTSRLAEADQAAERHELPLFEYVA